jgi:hypothetical protein
MICTCFDIPCSFQQGKTTPERDKDAKLLETQRRLPECYSAAKFQPGLPFTFHADYDRLLYIDFSLRSLIPPRASHSTSLHQFSIRMQVSTLFPPYLLN